LCVDVAGYKIINILHISSLGTHTNAHHRRSHTPVCTLATSTANMSTGITKKHLLPVRAFASGQYPTTLDYCMTQKEAASFSSHSVGSNWDVAFASLGKESRMPERRVLGKFPRSQHRASLIMPPRLIVHTNSDPMKR